MAMDCISHAQLRRCLGRNCDAQSVPVLVMAIVGAAGTGKTAVLRIIQPFADFQLGDESVLKSAPTNTASRVSGGDMCHALYKLPFGSFKSKRGQLTATVLQSDRARFRNVRFQNIDEVGMLAPSTLLQVEVRSRTATRDVHSVFGGVCTSLSGDFLQLPHPSLPSLANIAALKHYNNNNWARRQSEMTTKSTIQKKPISSTAPDMRCGGAYKTSQS